MAWRSDCYCPHEFRGMGKQPKAYDHRALRKGETSHKCERCGGEYVPNARTQKYCDECRRRKND